MQFVRLFRAVFALVVGLGMVRLTLADPSANQPNVLMIAIDDLNDTSAANSPRRRMAYHGQHGRPPRPFCRGRPYCSSHYSEGLERG